MKLGPSDRSEATQARYQQDIDEKKTVGLMNEPPIVDHQFWRLIVNRYPYDEKWCTSMMLVLKRECHWDQLTTEEVIELHDLSNKYLGVFDRIERNGSSLSSEPKCPHIHLLQGKK